MHPLISTLFFTFLHLLILGILSPAVCALKLTRAHVPIMVEMGEPFWLNCSYDLGDQGLYSIKWYHWNPDSSVNGEFYRWVPNDSPPGQMFALKGIHLDLSKSNHGNVYLTKSDLYTDGSFRCEVSAEAPSFQTVRKEKELHVFSLPSEKPSIKGIGSDPAHYGPGDLINVSCHTKSRPAAKIFWQLNGERVDDADRSRVKTIIGPKRSDGLETRRSELAFYSERGHYRNGLLKLQCVTDIYQQYNVHSEEIVINGGGGGGGGEIGGKSNIGARPSGSYRSSSYSVSQPTPYSIIIGNTDIPIISGVKSDGPYRVGEWINLTCISRAKTAPKLTFVVNDIEANSSQIRQYPVFRLSDGLYASKLGLEFRVQPNDLALAALAKRPQMHYTVSAAARAVGAIHGAAGAASARTYRIKCTASMEKNIYSAVSEVHLGTSKQSSGLHFAGNFGASHFYGVTTVALLLPPSNWICVIVSILSCAMATRGRCLADI